MKTFKLLLIFVLLLPIVEIKAQNEIVVDENQQLIEATKNCDYTAVSDFLKNGLTVNVKDEEGKTPLHWAVICGNPDLIRLLLFYKAEVQFTDDKGMSALDYAKLFEQHEVINLLQSQVKESISM
ncbi:ankyrin repeat domain-containing protein [Chondrinema litorale]|uniref:ankyrin repeat domain-containing protein n=1 Tax=Chondrinema litorale TaxID=2994555 RepID=UPI002542E0CF|nr:ankyrin repeat domain-containing protein [Chondrinema litorale]UZR94229.1 ankyrin repeat domain-containing protein [Chondrinema litorale]